MKMNYFYPVILFIFCAVFFSCAKEYDSSTEESTSSTNTAQSIANSDFQITNYTTLDNSITDGAVYSINNDSSYFDNDPNSSSTSCDYFDAISNAVFEADDNNTFKASVNDMSLTNCYPSYELTSSAGSCHMSRVTAVDQNGS